MELEALPFNKETRPGAPGGTLNCSVEGNHRMVNIPHHRNSVVKYLTLTGKLRIRSVSFLTKGEVYRRNSNSSSIGWPVSETFPDDLNSWAYSLQS